MKKWLPYVLAGAVGILVAVLLFGPGLGGGAKSPEKKSEHDKVTLTTSKGSMRLGGGEAATGDEDIVAQAKANPPPPPGTLRPMNQAEIDQAARRERPYNKHYAYVASWWTRAAQIVGAKDPVLGKEVAGMERILRDQSKLNDGEVDIPGTIQKERDLVAKVRGANLGDAELDAILSYIDQSSGVVLQGGDPTTVPKPEMPARTTSAAPQ